MKFQYCFVAQENNLWIATLLFFFVLMKGQTPAKDNFLEGGGEIRIPPSVKKKFYTCHNERSEKYQTDVNMTYNLQNYTFDYTFNTTILNTFDILI